MRDEAFDHWENGIKNERLFKSSLLRKCIFTRVKTITFLINMEGDHYQRQEEVWTQLTRCLTWRTYGLRSCMTCRLKEVSDHQLVGRFELTFSVAFLDPHCLSAYIAFKRCHCAKLYRWRR